MISFIVPSVQQFDVVSEIIEGVLSRGDIAIVWLGMLMVHDLLMRKWIHISFTRENISDYFSYINIPFVRWEKTMNVLERSSCLTNDDGTGAIVFLFMLCIMIIVRLLVLWLDIKEG